jgi:hypothetical protein
MKPRRLLGYSLLTLGLALLVAIFAAFQALNPPTRYLSGGLKISLDQYFPGPPYEYVPLDGWHRLIYPYLPVTERMKLGHGVIHIPNPGDSWPVAMIRFSGGGAGVPNSRGPGRRYRFEAANELGHYVELENGPGGGRSRTSSGGYATYSAWQLAQIPRRGREVRLRVHVRPADVEDATPETAEFVLPNPTPGPFPVWQPVSLPARLDAGDCEVIVERLRAGLTAEGLYINYRPHPSRWAALDLAIRRAGKPTDEWVPARIELQDATGNVYDHIQSNRKPTAHTGPGRHRLWFHDLFTTGEAAWKLKVYLRRSTEYDYRQWRAYAPLGEAPGLGRPPRPLPEAKRHELRRTAALLLAPER